MLKGLVKRHESLKKYIKTILDQLPQYIEVYPPEEQELLKEFLFILIHYEEADFKRHELSDRFERYRQDIILRKIYLNLPFLWFMSTYFRNALVILNNSGFHGRIFYEYLIKHLRGSDQVQGVYRLIRRKVPLSDLAWEKLQYESTKLLIPITKTQFQILDSLYTFIEKSGVQSLDPQKLKTYFVSQVNFPTNIKPSSEIKRLFSLINGRWVLRFSSAAFGLSRLLIQFQLLNSTSIEEIVNFQDPLNTVLCNSDIYKVRDSSETYIGNILIPLEAKKPLEKHFKELEEQKLLKLNKIKPITTVRTSISLTQYKKDFGWVTLGSTKLRKLASLLKSKQPKNRQIESSLFHFSRLLSNQLYYNKHPFPEKIVQLYCSTPSEYSYPYLPLKPKIQEDTTLSRTEIGLLKQLYYNKVVNVGFIPLHLVYDFSLDLYCITVPKLPNDKLKHFLALLPYSEIHYTENEINILARITPKLVEWIINDLNWPVQSILQTHYPLKLEFTWFNPKTLQWKIPIVLNKLEEKL